MSITNRLTVFFLGALALVLIGFSAAIYGVASWHLHAQLDRHLAAALETLIAAVEVHRDNVTWEPHERHVVLGNDPDLSQVRWTMHDELDKLIDCSANMADATSAMLPANSADWRQVVRRMNAGNFTAEIPPELPSPTTAEAIRKLPAPQIFRRASFTLCVALSELPVREALNTLLLALFGVSLALLAVATFCGRWLCRRVLSPVSQMAQSARLLQQTPEQPGLLEVSDNHDELTELGAAFNQLILSLRESIERQQRFAGDASHQLRTPLTAMLVAVDVAARQSRSIEEYKAVVETVQRRGRDLQQIVETLLALTRAKSPGFALESEHLELNDWCRAQLETWAGHPSLALINLRLSPAPLPVYLPKSLLAQIFDNLLENACKYSARDTPISIATRRDQESAYLSIQDQGPGIAETELEELFDPFFRTAEARDSGEQGFGLGLTLAQRLATAFGGKITATSVRGSGSEFTLQLPLVAQAPNAKLAQPDLLASVSS